jgi:hypothetical protein
MSFLDSNNSPNLAARLTKEGRNAIAKGNFVISYFAIGDSEYSYSGVTSQKVFAPFDKNTHVKYPIWYTSGSTFFGIPIQESTTTTVRNSMGPAGFVSQYVNNATEVNTIYNRISYSDMDGNNQITVTSGPAFQYCKYATLVLNSNDINSSLNSITGKTNSVTLKITGITSNTLYFDRPTPNLSSYSGEAFIACNEGEFQNPVLSDTMTQQNPWKVSVVWDKKPIGLGDSDRALTNYTSNKYVGIKEFFGYKTTSGQTNNTLNTIVNTMDELVTIAPEEQKCVAILHYSENGDTTVDPDRFFKYDDYISTFTGLTSPNIVSDLDYFQVYIPFIFYHRNTGTTLGAIFYMDDVDKQIVSNYNDRFILKYRDLIDEQGVRVGKVFYNQKTIIFDDEEIVAALDYKSNRKHTLPAPKVSSVITNDPITDLTSDKTMWVTYMLSHSSNSTFHMNGLPCNYHMKVTGTTPHSITVKFNSGEFTDLVSSGGQAMDGYLANKFHILCQITNNGQLPVSSAWRIMDYTTEAGGGTLGSLKSGPITFTINNTNYTNSSSFSLSSYVTGTDYTSTSGPYFGDEHAFPGSIRVVRATDFEEMNFKINLPSGKFTQSQQPNAPANPMITEIALLNDNKDVMVIAKTSQPVQRTGNQVFAVKLDF